MESANAVHRMGNNENKQSTTKIERSKGFGDTIEKIAHAVGADKIAQVIEKITKKDCGCSKRKELLNKVFPYGE